MAVDICLFEAQSAFSVEAKNVARVCALHSSSSLFRLRLSVAWRRTLYWNLSSRLCDGVQINGWLFVIFGPLSAHSSDRRINLLLKYCDSHLTYARVKKL